MRIIAILFFLLALWPEKAPSNGAEPNGPETVGEVRVGFAEKLDLSLPTENKSIFESRPDSFYMGVDRNGKRVWEGGTFGFVRSPMAWPGGTVCTQFHEGIDIAPVDRTGMPADEVKAISAGMVVLSEANGRSRYGNQVVCRHEWFGGPVFSRYAHLSSVKVAAGEKVMRGQVVGVIGYTGGALTRERAHLHLEINLMRNESCERSWLPGKEVTGEDANFHPGNFVGVDAAALFVALREKPALTFPEFVRSHPPYFTVTVAGEGQPVDLLKRHPWLGEGNPVARGWKISFTEWGLPVRFEEIEDPPAEPRVVWVRPFDGKHAWRTGGLLSGTGETASLNAGGLGLLRIILGRSP